VTRIAVVSASGTGGTPARHTLRLCNPGASILAGGIHELKRPQSGSVHGLPTHDHCAGPESLRYNWRSACRAAAARCGLEPLGFVPIGVVGRGDDGGLALLAAPQATRSERVERPGPRERVGMIELDLPGGARLRVDAFVNEKALRRVLRALKEVA
jgi:hypothetical protein